MNVMWICLSLLFVGTLAAPLLPSTNLWPLPQTYTVTNTSSTIYTVTDVTFSLLVKNDDDVSPSQLRISDYPFVDQAVSRYLSYMQTSINTDAIPSCVLGVDIVITDLSVTHLLFETDESYNLSVTAGGKTCLTSRLSSTTVFGMLRGLETLSQLLLLDCASYVPPRNSPGNQAGILKYLPIEIVDFPRYPWRGLLLDVARHFVPIAQIKTVIDGMSFDKLNVLHLHLVDAQSFPMEIPQVPELCEKGSYSDSARYSVTEMKDLLVYANNRGIRIVPEVDVPGHTYSWGMAFPELRIDCPPDLSYNINSFPLNPIKEETYAVVEKVLRDLSDIFTDEYFHIGGDELNFGCLLNDPEVVQYLTQHNLSEFDLDSLFTHRILPTLKDKNKISISWQERVMHENVTFQYPTTEVVEVWIDMLDADPIAARGYKILIAVPWYLANVNPAHGHKPVGHTFQDLWKDMYLQEFDEFLAPEKRHLVLGGEASMWGEQVSVQNVLSTIFPKTSAVAERLWSSKEQTFAVGDLWNDLIVEHRLMQHLCFVHRKRGVSASPVRPDYCPLPEISPVTKKSGEIVALGVSTGILGGCVVILLVGNLMWIVVCIRLAEKRKRDSSGDASETSTLL